MLHVVGRLPPGRTDDSIRETKDECGKVLSGRFELSHASFGGTLSNCAYAAPLRFIVEHSVDITPRTWGRGPRWRGLKAVATPLPFEGDFPGRFRVFLRRQSRGGNARDGAELQQIKW